MNEIKKGIDAGLSGMRASSDFLMRAEFEEKRRKKYGMWHSSAAVVVLCCILFGTVAIGAAIMFKMDMALNNEEIPKLDSMFAVEVNQVDGQPNEDGYLKKEYSSLEMLQGDLGITLLTSPLAAGNPYVKVWYERLGDTCHIVHLDDYIMGDLENIRPLTQEEWDVLDVPLEGNDESYIWIKGSKYKSPVDMKVQIFSDPEQQDFDMEYLGYYEYVKTITSKQGYKVNILRSSIEWSDLSDEERKQMEAWYVPKVEAAFVANGMYYTLSGMVAPETMEEIINSLELG